MTRGFGYHVTVMKILPTLFSVLALAACRAADASDFQRTTSLQRSPTMDLGAFSVSLAVRDLAASRAFYEKLGFEVAGGDAAQDWLILRNGTATIGPLPRVCSSATS